MEYRQLGRSGLRISAMTLGTMGFGGGGMYAKFGTGDVQDARRQIDLAIFDRQCAACRLNCFLEAGVNMIDTADIYSMGKAEEIVGEALGSRRDDVILATKARFPMGEGANDAGLSRHHLIRACEASRGGSAPITSTSTSSTRGMGKRRSRRPSAPSSTSSIAARCAMSGVRTSPAGR